MAILGNIIKQAIGLSKAMPTTPKNGARTQQKTLRKTYNFKMFIPHSYTMTLTKIIHNC